MRIYLDDDLDSNRLIDLFRLAGHEVISPRAVGTRGVADEEHLHYAFSHGLVLLTANAEDFIDLRLAKIKVSWCGKLSGRSCWEDLGVLRPNPTCYMLLLPAFTRTTQKKRWG